MYKQQHPQKVKPTLKQNTAYVGESIEQKVNRIINNKEPIKDGAPLIYTDRKDGVNPQYDIRTDRWDTAIEGMSVVDKTYKAQREQRIGERTYDTMTGEQQKAFNEKFPRNKHNMTQKNQNGGQSPASTNDQGAS